MAGVGAVTLLSLRGGVDLPSEEVEMIARANVDGTVIRETGSRARPFQATGLVDVASANLATARASMYALRSTTVTITLGTGEVYTNVTVVDVQVLDAVPHRQMNGGINVATGGTGFMLEVRFTLLKN